MYLLDTDVLTFWLRQQETVSQRMQAVPASTPVVTSIVSRIEILRGRFESIMKVASKEEWLRAQFWLNDTEQKLVKIDVVQVNSQAADRFEILLTAKKLRKMTRGDMLIASIALANQATLVTRNTKDFKLVPGLKIENWVD